MPVKKFCGRWRSVAVVRTADRSTTLELYPRHHRRVPHTPDFLCSFVGSLNCMRLSLKRAAHAVLSRAAYRKFGASRSFFARCGIPQASPSNRLRADRSVGVPHVRTSVRGPKTVGEALRKPFVLLLLAVLNDWLEGPVFKEIYQAGPDMIDVVVHCSLCRFTIVCFEGLQDRQVGI
jgi:hypothetical protein